VDDAATALRAVIFDFDGLILDTETPIFQSWQEIYRKYGAELTLQVWGQMLGTSDAALSLYDRLAEQTGCPLDAASLEGERAGREAELIAGEMLRPGVRSVLRQAHDLGLGVGLASSAPCAWVKGHLERFGLLDDFQAVYAADDVPAAKPDPALYLAAAAALGVQPCQAVALEDSPNGILAARRAGIYCVAVPNDLTRLYPLDHADQILDSLEQLDLAELAAAWLSLRRGVGQD
jgi:HAD superfamily hydrolase (TIGR01509 family)